MTWVLFDYGGVICTPQPDSDVARLAGAAGVPVPAFRDAYWAHRLDYDRAELDGTTYWQKVAAGVGRSFTTAQVAELIRLDIASWLHLRAGTVALIEDVAAAGYRLALLSNAPAETAEVVAGLPVAAHFEHCAFSYSLRSVKPEPECYRAVLAMLVPAPPTSSSSTTSQRTWPGRRRWACAACNSPSPGRLARHWPPTE